MKCEMILLMSNAGHYGQAMMALVDREIAALGMSRNAWADEHGVSGSNLTKWAKGVQEPSIESVREIAEALGVPLIELLAVMIGLDRGAKYMPADRPITVEQAVAVDASLTDGMRTSLGVFLAAIRDVAANGGAITDGDATVTKRTSRRGK